MPGSGFFHLVEILICRSYLWHIWPKIWSNTFVVYRRRRGWSHFLFLFSYSLGECSGVFFSFSKSFVFRSYLGHFWAKIWLYFLTFLILVESL